MRVISLSLRRFLAWENLDLDLPEKISIFVGRNGSGKSSILDAIRVLVTRTARGLPKGDIGRLSSWQAEKPFRVEAVLGVYDAEGTFCGSRVRRTPATLTAIGDDEVAVKIGERQLAEALTENPEAIDAVFDVGKALTMAPGDRRALVHRLAGGHVKEITRELLEEMGLHDDRILGFAIEGNWAKAVRDATDRRRAAQAALDAIDLSPPADVSIGDAMASDVDEGMLEEARKALVGLKADLREVFERIGATKAPVDPAKIAAEIEREVKAAAAAAQQLAKVGPEVERAGKEEKRLRAILESRREECLAAEKTFDGARKASGRHDCPICGHSHDWPKEIGREALSDLMADAKSARETFEKAEKDYCDADYGLRRLVKQEVRLAEDVRSAERKIAELEQKEKEARAAADDPDALPDLALLDEQRADLERRIAKGEEMIRAAETYSRALLVHEEAKAKAKRLHQAVADLKAEEDLCRQDREGNIPARLLQDALDPFRACLQRWEASRLFATETNREGLQVIGIDVDPDFVPQLVDAAGNRHYLDTANASVTWRAGFVFAAALAELSGLRFLPLDEVTFLDAENRAGLVTELMDRLDAFDQVLICAVRSGEVIQPPTPDVRFYLLQGGKAARLEDGEVVE